MKTLGVLLSPGDSIKSQKETGQFDRFLDFYLKRYEKNFNKVFIFSYLPEKDQFGRGIKVIPNNHHLHRFIYSLLMPFLNFREFREVNIFRVMQLTGALPAIIAKLFLRKPYLATYGYRYHKFAQIEGKVFQAFLLRIFEPIALFFADGIIVTTQELKHHVGRFKDKRRIYFVPNGVDTTSFSPRKLKKETDSWVLLSVGRLEKQKNYLSLVRAVASSDFKEKITLRLIGDGSQKTQINRLAQRLKVRLRVKSNITHAKMPSIYQRADVFVLPSLIEGHPKVLLEALSCGLPAIASRVSGSQEVIKDGLNGLLCGIESDDIASKIDMLIRNKNLRGKVSQAASEYILKYYDLEKLILKEIKILQNIPSKSSVNLGNLTPF